jgi:hypothetical protein
LLQLLYTCYNFSRRLEESVHPGCATKGIAALGVTGEEFIPVTDERAEVPLSGAVLPPELLEALARGVAAAFAPPQPATAAAESADFLTAGQFADRLGVSRETVRRLAIADVLPCTVVCRGSRKTTRRYPRRFVDDFAASGQDVTDLAEFAVRWRARMAAAAAQSGSV